MPYWQNSICQSLLVPHISAWGSNFLAAHPPPLLLVLLLLLLLPPPPLLIIISCLHHTTWHHTWHHISGILPPTDLDITPHHIANISLRCGRRNTQSLHHTTHDITSPASYHQQISTSHHIISPTSPCAVEGTIHRVYITAHMTSHQRHPITNRSRHHTTSYRQHLPALWKAQYTESTSQHTWHHITGILSPTDLDITPHDIIPPTSPCVLWKAQYTEPSESRRGVAGAVPRASTNSWRAESTLGQAWY